MGRSTNQPQQRQTKSQEISPEQLIGQMFGGNHYDEASRIISLYGDVSEHMMQHIIMQIVHFSQTSSVHPINMIVSTYGGSVDEMFSLYDIIKFVKPPIHTIGLGKIMSAGTLLLASGEKGSRLIGQSSRVMIHPISGGTGGDIFKVENDVSEMRRLQSLMTDRLVNETKLSKTDVEDIMKKGKDHYLTAEQAIECGIVDKLMLQPDV